ncbi:hypothetical protein, partial [Yanghanlia caeni]|nr:hypothetical protein [Alcaligenaceae bacterium LG-2]
VRVVRRSFQIILAEASVGGGFFQRPVKQSSTLFLVRPSFMYRFTAAVYGYTDLADYPVLNF